MWCLKTKDARCLAEQHFSWCGKQLPIGVIKLIEMLLSDIFWGKPDFSSINSIQKTLSISPIILFLALNVKSTHMCVWLPNSCSPLGKIRRQKTEQGFCLSEQMRIIYMYKLFIERLQQANWLFIGRTLKSITWGLTFCVIIIIRDELE